MRHYGEDCSPDAFTLMTITYLSCPHLGETSAAFGAMVTASPVLARGRCGKKPHKSVAEPGFKQIPGQKKKKNCKERNLY